MAQEVPTSPTCQVIILTALSVEFRAVVAYLQEAQEIIHPQGTIYRVGSFVGNHGPLRVAVAQIGMGGGSAAVETERAIHFFHPHLSLFVGIAGGLKDVQIGDVVAATKVYDYEPGKAGQTFEPRPEVWRASYPLEQRARQEISDEAWQVRLGDALPDPVPRAHIGALAAGEKVLASTQSAVYAHIKATYGDALAIEMEGHGFLQAVHINHDMNGLVIRGISDLIDGKAAADAGGSQSRAAHHAAAFAFQVLATFTFPPSVDAMAPLAHRDVWNVPYPRNPYFTGRDELLDQLDRQLSPETLDHPTSLRRAALTQPQAIKGLGGIGKTQIAVEYVYRSRDLDRYTHVLWIYAASEEVLLTSIVALAQQLPAFPAKDETDQHKLVEAVKRWLETCNERWLLIFDNADDVALLRDYLPHQGNGSILLTTRANAVGSLATSVEVETMGFSEGTQLLLRRAQRLELASDEEINQAGNIVVVLDHLPLALDQAGAYIEETQCSFEEYLALYRTHRQNMLARRGIEATNYPDSVVTTWLLSFQKIEQANPAAAELLRLCAFLAPDKIPEELIRDGATQWSPLLRQAAADLFTFNQMMADLLRYSLVKRLTEAQTFSIHRLVQAVQMDMMEPEVQRQWAERVVRAANEVFPDNPEDISTWPQCLRYLDQAQICSMLIKQYGFSFTEAADLLNRTGAYLDEHALYTIAEPLYEHALLIREQQLGPQHPDTATSLNNLAVLYQHQGKYAQAEELHRHALEIREHQLGPQHLETAFSLNNLAIAYMKQGKYAEAEPLLKRTLEIREQQVGSEHPDMAFSLDTLAGISLEQKKYFEAEELYQRALEIREQQLGGMHLTTAFSLNNLALFYAKRGEYSKAEPLLRRALEIREQRLGAKHPDTATSFDALAFLYEEQGKYTQAEELYRHALEIREQQLGVTHPITVLSLSELALYYIDRERYTEAEPLLKRTLEIQEQQLGTKHSDTNHSLNALAALYMKQGKYVEAEPLLRQALEIREQQVGPDHLDTAFSLNALGILYQAQERYNEAESLLKRALSICEQQLGVMHPNTVSRLITLASLYQAQSNYAKAELLYQQALAIYESILGQEHSTTRKIRENYASLLRTAGRDAEAKQLEEGS